MPIESAGATHSWTTSSMSLLAAHPIGAAVAGGVLIGVATFYLVKKFSKKKDQPVAVA